MIHVTEKARIELENSINILFNFLHLILTHQSPTSLFKPLLSSELVFLFQMALQDFPPEILVEIFSNLRLRDLFACDGTCRVFHQLFTDSSYLKYRIELEKTGMIDNPYCQLPTRMKVEMLLEI